MAVESTDTGNRKYCHSCGVDLMPGTTEYVIGVHVECVARLEHRINIARSPAYGWRRKTAEAPDGGL